MSFPRLTDKQVAVLRVLRLRERDHPEGVTAVTVALELVAQARLAQSRDWRRWAQSGNVHQKLSALEHRGLVERLDAAAWSGRPVRWRTTAEGRLAA